MVYIMDVMLPVEIDTPPWRRFQFNEEANNVGLKCVAYLINESREVAHVQEFATKNRATRRYNSKFKPREMQEGLLVLKEVVLPT